MIYTEPISNNVIDENGQPKDKKLNSERYTLREVSNDMAKFIVKLIVSLYLGFS